VIGVPDERWGEQILAVVKLRDGAPAITADELYQFCCDRISAHKAPTQWVFTDRLPMTPTGKIQKFLLREQLASGELSERLVLTKSASRAKTS
jgi:acyl-CoA synthetase (AMP-forming)/AMP-acid ligase II